MENFKDITEHQLDAGEIGVYKDVMYLAFRYNGCVNCSLFNISKEICNAPPVKCSEVAFKLVTKKEDINPILESIDDTSDDNSAPIETITITKSEYKDLLYHSLYYYKELSEIDRHNKELKTKIDKLHAKIKDLLDGRDNNS